MPRRAPNAHGACGVADEGWKLLRLAALLRTLERHQSQALGILHRLDPRMRPSLALTLKAAELRHLHREGFEIAQLAEQIDALLDTLSDAEPLAVSYGSVHRSAVRVLRHGDTLDVAAILLAAELLDRATGLPALAEGLRASGAYASWHGTMVCDLVGAFRGVSPQLARRIVAGARLEPGVEIARCHPDEVAQLADQLDVHAVR